MKLWDKGISIDKKIEQFTVGNDREIDIHIAKYDVIASRAHAKMLKKIGILTANELVELLTGLKKLEDQIDNGTFVIEAQFEDVPRDMKSYTDADGNLYDFAFGLNWNGIIQDKRVTTYK